MYVTLYAQRRLVENEAEWRGGKAEIWKEGKLLACKTVFRRSRICRSMILIASLSQWRAPDLTEVTHDSTGFLAEGTLIPGTAVPLLEREDTNPNGSIFQFHTHTHTHKNRVWDPNSLASSYNLPSKLVSTNIADRFHLTFLIPVTCIWSVREM